MPGEGVKTNKRAVFSLLLILVFLSSYLLPIFLTNRPVSAAQLTQRKITLGSSKPSATDVTYSVSVLEATASATLKGIVIEFCDSTTGPIIGNPCTAPSGFNINKASLAIGALKINGSTPTNAYTINAASNSNTLILTNSTGNSISATNSITFTMGTDGTGGDGVTNPSTTGSFYARILTYDNNTTAAAYTDISPGTHLDDGGIALSTANQLNVSARVQEILQFCVGTTSVNDATTPVANDCGGTFAGNCGQAVDLGVLDGSAVSVSPVATTPGIPGNGNGCNGAAMVRTNAGNGVSITYFPELDTGSGKLKVIGQTCSGSSVTDQCFNDSASQAAFTAGVENFGMDIAGTNCSATTTVSYTCSMSGGSNQLKAVSGYIGDSTTAYGTTNGFAWDDTGFTSPTQIASSSGPVEDETLILKFAATNSITTPTGAYTVSSTYVATGTF